MNKLAFYSTLAFVAGAAFVTQARAATTDTFDVKIQITAACNITTTAADIDFGVASFLTATDIDQNTNFAVQCTPDSPYSISLTSASGNATRTMSDGAGNTIGYQLYKEAARSTVWGDAGGALVGAVGGLVPTSFSVYGRVPVAADNLNKPVGNYADTVTINVIL